MSKMKNGRIPFGYDIVNGAAVINEATAGQLKTFFQVFLAGETMAEAARQAQLSCSMSTYPHFFQRKEYIGTEYYPAIITPEYQAQLIAEWKKRKGETRRKQKKPSRKGVPLYTDFRLTEQQGTRQEDPADFAAAFYRCIRPCYKGRTTQTGL